MADSVATSRDNHDRPLKRRALSPTSKQAASLDALFANPAAALKDPSTRSRELGPPPEVVNNVQGSSAGAGSGEFHVYKASRRREYERLRVMDEESRREEEDEKHEREREERRRRDEEKTGKNRARRMKAKARKEKGGSAGGDGGKDAEAGLGQGKVKAKLKANGLPAREDGVVMKNANGEERAPATEEVGIVIHDDD